MAKTRINQLFAEFLSLSPKPAREWTASYTRNPLLRSIARLLVWSQNGATFTLDADGRALDCFGNEYSIDCQLPICVAHPMEMTVTQVEAWQKYFTKCGLKQPFEQIWEPVRNPEEVKRDRYYEAIVNPNELRFKEKHGISFKYSISAGDVTLGFKDCELGYELIECDHHYLNSDAKLKLYGFSFDKYTRQVNHIVALLDKWTAAHRVKNDDISVCDLLDGFTLAQITELLDTAVKNNAVACTAALLNYKGTHFDDYDPMDALYSRGCNTALAQSA